VIIGNQRRPPSPPFRNWQPDERTVDAVIEFIQSPDFRSTRYIKEHFFPTPVDPDLVEAEEIVRRSIVDGNAKSAANLALVALKRGRELAGSI